MYDAIVVGARCAGSPTAMLLARNGHKVLLVDRARFPSDTMSTHILWPPGAEVLKGWGLLDRLAVIGLSPIVRNMCFDVGPFALTGGVPDANDGEGGFCPRRIVLDKLLVDAAVEAGAELREGFSVDELLFEGDKVAGIRGRASGGQPVEERAAIVIGADGVNSFVAKAVQAPDYDSKPALACYYYSYYSGVPQDDIELYVREGCAVGGAPTNDGLNIVIAGWPAARFPEVRPDVEPHVMKALDEAPRFAERVRGGKREEKWYGTAGVPNYIRKSHGPGWALVGDAGYSRDPITAQGISDSLLDAGNLAAAIHSGLSGERLLEEALAEHEAARNERVRPMYEFTCQLAVMEPPPPAIQQLFGALHSNQEATNQFFSALTGAMPLTEFMSEENLGRIMSAAGASPNTG